MAVEKVTAEAKGCAGFISQDKTRNCEMERRKKNRFNAIILFKIVGGQNHN